MFEKTPINPDLVSSIEHVYTLRNIARQFFVNQRLQTLTVQNEVERARSIVALVDVLQRADRVGRVLVLSQLSATLDKIELSFKLHTCCAIYYLDEKATFKEVNFVRYSKFLNLAGHHSDDIAAYLTHFDLIIVDDLDNEKNQIFKLKLLAEFKGWVLNVLPIEDPILML